MADKCPDYVKELNDYLDGTLDPALCREIEAHVGECRNCRIMIDSLRQTATLCRDGVREKLPEQLDHKLTGLLKARWDQKFGKQD